MTLPPHFHTADEFKMVVALQKQAVKDPEVWKLHPGTRTITVKIDMTTGGFSLYNGRDVPLSDQVVNDLLGKSKKRKPAGL